MLSPLHARFRVCVGPAPAQIVTAPGKKKTVQADDVSTSLVEVGPRACLQPIKIFAGSFEGQILYENPAYVSPNKVRPPVCRHRSPTEIRAKLVHQMRSHYCMSIAPVQ